MGAGHILPDLPTLIEAVKNKQVDLVGMPSLDFLQNDYILSSENVMVVELRQA